MSPSVSFGLSDAKFGSAHRHMKLAADTTHRFDSKFFANAMLFLRSNAAFGKNIGFDDSKRIAWGCLLILEYLILQNLTRRCIFAPSPLKR